MLLLILEHKILFLVKLIAKVLTVKKKIIGADHVVLPSFYKAFLEWKPIIFWKSINEIFDGWSLIFHMSVLYILYFTFSTWWHPLLLEWPCKILNYGPLDFYLGFFVNWVWFWTMTWYIIIIYALIWAHRWTPDPTSGWTKPTSTYWQWWNKKILFFIPEFFLRADENTKGKRYFILFLFLVYFVYRDWLFLQHAGIYILFIEDFVFFYNFPWYGGFTLFIQQIPMLLSNVIKTKTEIGLLDFLDAMWFCGMVIVFALLAHYIALLLWIPEMVVRGLFYHQYHDMLEILWMLWECLILIFNFSSFFIFFTFLNFLVRKISPLYLLLWLIMLMINTILAMFAVRIEFFSILILIVYIGAIAILFLFVIMLLDLREENETFDKNKIFRYIIISICVTCFDFYVRHNIFEIKIFSVDLSKSSESINLPDIFNIVFNLYTYELIPLLILSILLLVTMIGSIAFLIARR